MALINMAQDTIFCWWGESVVAKSPLKLTFKAPLFLYNQKKCIFFVNLFLSLPMI